MPTTPTARILILAAALTGVAWGPGTRAPSSERGQPEGRTGRPAEGATTQADGRALAAELGCGGCHAGMPDPAMARSRAPVFGAGGNPLPGDFVFTYLADPQPRRTDIGRTRMPDFGLGEAERVALAAYLGTGDAGGDFAAASRRHPDANAQVGSRIFGVLGCAACHEHGGRAPRLVGPDLSREGSRVQEAWMSTFLASPTPVRGDGHPARPGARMPDFRLDEDEIKALAPFLLAQGRTGSWTPEPLTPFQMRRTERLVKDRLACLGCHTLDGEGGRIGPSLDGIAHRLHPAYVLAMVTDPEGTVPGSGMPRQHLEARDARRVASFLLQLEGTRTRSEYRSLADSTHPSNLVAMAEAATEGEALYLRHCAACHGVNGRVDGFNTANLPVLPSVLSSAEIMVLRPDDSLFDGIHAGAYVLDGSPRMPPFGEMFSADQIRSLVDHIRVLCNCEGPDWSRDGRAP